MRKRRNSLAHKVKIPNGRKIDLEYTNVAKTFERVRREQAAREAEAKAKVATITKRAIAGGK